MYFENFEKLCKDRRITVSRVSQETGVSKVTFSAWKKGDYTPKMDKLQKIADFFNVSIEYLTTGKEKETSAHSAEALEMLELYEKADPTIQQFVLNALKSSQQES